MQVKCLYGKVIDLYLLEANRQPSNEQLSLTSLSDLIWHQPERLMMHSQSNTVAYPRRCKYICVGIICTKHCVFAALK